MQAKVIQALWLYMPPYVNSTADIIITSISSTASSKRRKLQATAGSADVSTEFDVTDAHNVADTATHLTDVIDDAKFLVGHVLCCAVLCCAVLCCAVLCCAVLCCAVLCCAVLCCAVLCCAVLCCAVLCCAVLCCAVLCCAYHQAVLDVSCYAVQTTLQTLGLPASSVNLLSTQSTVPGLASSVCTLNNSTGTCMGERSSCIMPHQIYSSHRRNGFQLPSGHLQEHTARLCL